MQHHPHHAQQGPPPAQQHLQQHPRPSSIVHQQHHPQAPPPPQQQQHSNPYPQQPQHLPQQYSQGAQAPAGQHPQEIPYYNAHPSPYSTPSASGTYTSQASDIPDNMAAAQMTRPYPPISYHTPQSNSPASVASPQQHDQHRMYGAPASQLQQNPQMYYPPPQHYPPMPPQGGPSPYAQPQQHHQSMTSQPNLLMSHAPNQHPMQQHPSQQHQQQPGMTGSPRPKMEPHVPQMPRPAVPLGPPQHQANTPQMNQNNIPGGNGVNPNAAPGPIPATTPLVVRQDNNGVQWIAFEYSRDRVKMEYTIRCDVESVNVDNLSPEFKTENCVYPRACCSKDQYRGNRLVYETECNTVGWALAELNPCLRGKRGLIQRAVDSWRNSNQDPRLRSRRVRRMAKLNNRKAAVQAHQAQNPHMGGPTGPTGMPPSGVMPAPGPPQPNMGKPSIAGMGGAQLHHHHAHHDGQPQGGEEVGDGQYLQQQQQQHQQQQQAQQQAQQQQQHSPSLARNGPPGNAVNDIRQSHVFQGYGGATNYPPQASPNGAAMPPSIHPNNAHLQHSGLVSSRRHSHSPSTSNADHIALFGDIPESKRRKFILVDDTAKGNRVRVRVTLDTVDIQEIPDSFRKSNSVYPRTWFPVEMQSRPSSPCGSRFFEDDLGDEDFNGDDDGVLSVEGGSRGRKLARERARTMVSVPVPDGTEVEVATPRMKKFQRRKEARLNDLGYRMTWHQSRVFADKTVFLQKALDSYRNKVRSTMEATGKDVPSTAAHFETRVGKRIWNDRVKRMRGGADEE
ncbi:hypothetical protein F5884DRAFT_239537 [Xylogone sp. PMI_703]|nr:hypothetical protein F5884DRAFT_239537 [Xylogone sp. PMI_703]